MLAATHVYDVSFVRLLAVLDRLVADSLQRNMRDQEQQEVVFLPFRGVRLICSELIAASARVDFVSGQKGVYRFVRTVAVAFAGKQKNVGTRKQFLTRKMRYLSEFSVLSSSSP